MDQFGVVKIELENPSRRNAVIIENMNGINMWSRHACADIKKVATHHGYIVKFIAVDLQIVTMLHYHERRKTRKLQYLLQSKAISGTAVKAILYD